jgi:acyl-coenzyme A thioesterase 13
MENRILAAFKTMVGKEFSSPSPVGKWLEGRLVEATEGSTVVTYTVLPHFANPMGLMHGGVYATMLDDVIGATVYAMDNEFMFTTINLNIDYLSAAKVGEIITVEAHIVRLGKNVIHCEAKMYNSNKKILAKASSNMAKTHILAK